MDPNPSLAPQLSSPKLSVRDLSWVMKKYYEHRNEWYNIGIALLIDEGTLDTIQQYRHERFEDCFRDMLLTWLRSEKPATESQLINATRKVKPTMYFHIQNKQEVRLIKATGEDVVTLPKRDKLTYYRTGCTYSQDVNGSRFNDEQKSICLSHIDGRLRDFFTAMKEESAVDEILFQARFGNMYFTFPCQENWDNTVVSTDDLQKMVHNKFNSFSIPGSVNLQTFLQNHCHSAIISQVTRYKIQFKIFADDASSLVKAGCHIEEQGDTFTHIWTRISVKDEIKDAWQDVKNIDIICPGRHIDMRIISHFQIPCRPEDDPARTKIGERIAKSMTRDRKSGHLLMQVAAQDFCVVFIRKKIMTKYSWIDPNQKNPGWTITKLCAHNTRNMEHEYLRLRRDKKYNAVPVNFNGRVVTELEFSGSTHATKPSDDPNHRVPTPDEFVANFKTFVEASFCVADQLN